MFVQLLLVKVHHLYVIFTLGIFLFMYSENSVIMLHSLVFNKQKFSMHWMQIPDLILKQSAYYVIILCIIYVISECLYSSVLCLKDHTDCARFLLFTTNHTFTSRLMLLQWPCWCFLHIWIHPCIFEWYENLFTALDLCSSWWNLSRVQGVAIMEMTGNQWLSVK